MSYAAETEVSVEKTKAQIESLLMKGGADSFAAMSDREKAAVAFGMGGKTVRFVLPLPILKDFITSPKGNTRHGAGKIEKTWEQACRSRWRGLYLNIRAKLEAVEIGITSFESEFLAHFVLPNGKTVGEEVLPKLEDATKKHGQPLLLNF